MIKTIHTWTRGNKFEHEAEVLELAKYFPARTVKVTVIDSAEEKRTVDQNKALWKWNKFLGDEVGYTHQEMHYVMCGEIFGWDNVNVGGEIRSIPRKTTSNLTKAEWQDYIADYRNIARSNYNVELPPFGYED